MPEPEIARRPLKSRGTRWAASAARWVASIGLRPNQISVLSVFFAALACGCLVLTRHVEGMSVAWLFLGSAAGVQLRLLCNLLDGMVAVEGGFRTKSGEIFNGLPDRFADALILAGTGYSLGTSPTLAKKDYGQMIEGHGGVLDRIDSICFAAPVFFHLTRFYFTE